MQYGLIHTGNDYSPQMVTRCVYLDQTERQKAKGHKPYELVAVPGFYRPDIPTPVGGQGQCDLETAKELDADPNCPLKLVEIEPEELEAAEQTARDTHAQVQAGIAEDKKFARQDKSREAMRRAELGAQAAGLDT